jgi:hypothetical protein
MENRIVLHMIGDALDAHATRARLRRQAGQLACWVRDNPDKMVAMAAERAMTLPADHPYA